MPVVNRNEDLSKSAQIALYCEQLNELENSVPEYPGEAETMSRMRTELLGIIYANESIVLELVNGDELYPEVLETLHRLTDGFEDAYQSSFWRMTGCSLAPEGRKFRTSDGYVLHESGDTWGDGDLVFESGDDGMPVEDGGDPVEGSLIE